MSSRSSSLSGEWLGALLVSIGVATSALPADHMATRIAVSLVIGVGTFIAGHICQRQDDERKGLTR